MEIPGNTRKYQLAAETRLIEAWKAVLIEDNCMREVLKLRHRGNYRTRNNHVDFLEPGVDDIYGSAGFVQTTAKLWNASPMSVKEAPTISLAKKEIRNFVTEKMCFLFSADSHLEQTYKKVEREREYMW